MRGVWWGAIALVGIGCATLPPCPHRGGPPWHQYLTAHFDVRTDLGPRDAEEVVRNLEEMRATMLSAGWGGRDDPHDRTQVIVLASHSARAVFIGTTDGMTVRRPPFATTLLFAGVNGMSLSSLRHELAHDISRWFLPVQPDWFSEGLATYMETIRYDRGLRRGYMGDVPLWRIRGIWNGGMFDIDRLLDRPAPEDSWELGRFEDTSWLLFHYLINNRSDALARYQRRLAMLEPSSQAWTAEFPDLDHAALERALTEYSKTGKFGVGYKTIAPWKGDVRVRSLSDAEVHAVRAYGYSFFRPPGKASDNQAAAEELGEAFRQDHPPLDALALAFYVHGGWQGVTRATLAQWAVATAPDSQLAWMMLADSTNVDDPEYRTALVRALARGPENRDVLERLTFLVTRQQRWNEALAFSSKALDNGSTRDELRLAHLQALAMTGQCAEAALWANVLGSLGPKQPKGFTGLWARLRQGCATAPPAPGPVPRARR